MNEKFLIINADDYGINEQTNAAVFQLFEQKRISSASVLAVGPRAEQALEIAAENKYPVGIHFAFNSDSEAERWHSFTLATSLNDGKGLHHDQKQITLHAKSADITTEMEAQYRFMVENGCVPDHADSHCGTLFGINGRLFFLNAFRFCAAHNLPFCLPKRPRFLTRQLGSGAAKLLQPLHKSIVAIGMKMGVMLPDDMFSNPYSIRKIESYATLRDYYIREMRALEPGITELFLHPSFPLGYLNDAQDEWTKREYECRLLMSGDLLEIARDEGIRLVSWGEAPFDGR